MSPQTHGRWPHEEYCSALEAETARFVEAVRGADLSAGVPTCPGWTLVKLLKHVGITHRWAEHIVRERVTERVSSRDVPVALPDDDRDYPGWLAEGARSLVGTLRAADPGEPVWTWGEERGAHFWTRRMLHEGTVHRADAEIALGREPRVDARVAADGVEEFLGNLTAAWWLVEPLRELGGGGETLHFHATDAAPGAGEWTVTLAPGGLAWERGHGKGDVAARGATGDLLLLLYGRWKPADARLETFGDVSLLARWQEKTAF
ncbi:maleylpyruvate isomerase family mycothiol-dependent enzyme [Sphaerisporangium sp. TRM90804]|uniref:maleylpyruvate isomerase family mycothiol-dependent enzyme n=1 Tax=Sphaerisporangium sp. TRM90804 TaxID=3031113 RepID=UPI002447386A|nr:maleylpyruvate isomerase family mycothiol-dependent enzyme [Sphaerisporangium sp. TRM90804]MDH2429115.1 maleylpyruvate isomerase family mycothiol-dependent enzyme [Sphaerisporangium sp. TRM90804]